MTLYKAIAYAYPLSINAERLGCGETGAWYVAQTIDGRSLLVTKIAHNCEGFATPDDPDLIALFNEYEGEPCPYFRKFGNPKALSALGLTAS